MSKAKQIIELTEQGLKPKEIAKRTRAKISYVYFVRKEVKKGGKKKPSEIIKAVKQTKAALDVMEEGTKIGGLTLTKVDDKSYRWVRDDLVNHPPHYKAGGIETIDFIEAKDLNYRLGNVIKYVSRAGKKDSDPIQDLEKAAWYLQREIDARKNA